MSNYRRYFIPGGTWFFTINLLQRHFWEHAIKDETDFQRHIDYVHVNPLKHKLLSQVKDWPYSSFHRYVEGGIYPVNWCREVDLDVHGDQ